MAKSEARDSRQHGLRISRGRGLILGLVVVSIIYPLMVGVLPWGLSLLTPRYGWTESRPAVWNLVGLLPVMAGIAGLVWVFSVMFTQFPKLPETVEFDKDERLWSATSRVLITNGPFARSRNPMFLAGMTVWLGWAAFYGSWVIAMMAVVLWSLSNYFKVPHEERGLEARFGEAYRDYCRKVPRWL